MTCHVLERVGVKYWCYKLHLPNFRRKSSRGFQGSTPTFSAGASKTLRVSTHADYNTAHSPTELSSWRNFKALNSWRNCFLNGVENHL